MKVLLVADEESAYIWDHFDAERFKGVDLILSCGDLKAEYLSFLVTMIPAPLFYVPGNHDKLYVKRPPGGCVNADGALFVFNGLRILGLGGCKSPRPCDFEYTEEQMVRKIYRLRHKIKKSCGFDVLLTHTPAFGLGDGEDAFHAGFKCFRELIDRHTPRFHFYGHQHRRYGKAIDMIEYGATSLINVTGYKILEI